MISGAVFWEVTKLLALPLVGGLVYMGKLMNRLSSLEDKMADLIKRFEAREAKVVTISRINKVYEELKSLEEKQSRHVTHEQLETFDKFAAETYKNFNDKIDMLYEAIKGLRDDIKTNKQGTNEEIRELREAILRAKP